MLYNSRNKHVVSQKTGFALNRAVEKTERSSFPTRITLQFHFIAVSAFEINLTRNTTAIQLKKKEQDYILRHTEHSLILEKPSR